MQLNPGEIHIWYSTIDERYEKLLTNSFLSVNEKRNAARFSYDIDSYLFTVRHNLLRIILGDYLSCDPLKIKFNSNHYQKPHIVHPNTNIHFNISVSSNRFVAVFCKYATIGIDIELIRQIDDIKQLSYDYFTKAEIEWITTQPESILNAAFFYLWSKKEALVKAIGKGLSINLNTIDVLSDSPIEYGDNVWNIMPLTLFDDCKAAMAINNTLSKISYYNTSDLLSSTIYTGE
jgi:4'-phosphopantetheinyl transferase